MARKNRKIHKKRGSRTSGHGHHNKNRGAGNRGGVGMAGGHKGKWSWIVKNKPEHFGRKRATIPPAARRVYMSINVGDLDLSIERLLDEGVAVKKGKGYEIDLTKTDFYKVLGRGKVKNPLRVRAMSFSSLAREKIEKLGGKVTVAGEEAE